MPILPWQHECYRENAACRKRLLSVIGIGCPQSEADQWHDLAKASVCEGNSPNLSL
jgi:hypothetical protein